MKISAVKGFHDALPEESARWGWIERCARAVFTRYNYGEIRLPIAEKIGLFARSIGETSDIVEKEMYTFEDRDGSTLALRPEATASVVRAYVEHSMHVKEGVSRLFYLGPMFRRERPQKGRYRQFHQIGVEVFGREDAMIDAEVILLVDDLLNELQVRSARFELNSLGCGDCRPAYRDRVRAFGEAHLDELCENCRRRLAQNPLRILDCKQEGCRAATEGAPRMLDHLCAVCRRHFDAVVAAVQQEGVAAELNPRLVRGLDYYCRTAFEIVSEGLGSQNAVGGGGRYDGLVKALGGPDVPGVGVALGVERLAMVAGAGAQVSGVEVFIVPLGESADHEALRLAHRLRRAGVRVEVDSGGKSLKSQMRRADKQGARFAVILGEDELAQRAATVRDMSARLDFRCAVGLDGDPSAFLTELRRLAAEPAQQRL